MALTSASPSAAELMMFDSWRRSGSIAIVMPARPRLGSDALAELDELRERLGLAEPVGHAARAAAAEHDDFRAEPREPAERLRHVGHLRVAIDRGPGHLERARQEEIHDRHRQPDCLDLPGSLVELGVREPRQLGRPELDVVEPRRLDGGQLLERPAKTDLYACGLGRRRQTANETPTEDQPSGSRDAHVSPTIIAPVSSVRFRSRQRGL